MSEYSNETLTALLGELKNDINGGFEGVHIRQDKTNGNIKDNAKEIEKLKIWKAGLVGGWTVLSILVVWLIAIVS